MPSALNGDVGVGRRPTLTRKSLAVLSTASGLCCCCCCRCCCWWCCCSTFCGVSGLLWPTMVSMEGSAASLVSLSPSPSLSASTSVGGRLSGTGLRLGLRLTMPASHVSARLFVVVVVVEYKRQHTTSAAASMLACTYLRCSLRKEASYVKPRAESDCPVSGELCCGLLAALLILGVGLCTRSSTWLPATLSIGLAMATVLYRHQTLNQNHS